MKIVKDTDITKTFEIKTFDIDTLITESSLTGVREFFCPSVYLETQIIERIQNALISKGYDLNGAENNKLDKITKEALLLFQKDNNLSVGNLDLETLRKLGLN